MGMVFCRGCGKEIHESAISCPHCGAPQNLSRNSNDEIPDGVRGWSWGAFLLNWIWAIGNHVWIGLLAIIPFVGLIVAIWLGFKGREMAWKTGKWNSVEEFQRVQKKWSNWAVGLVLFVMVIGILAGIAIPAYSDYVKKAEEAKLLSEQMQQQSINPNVEEVTQSTPQSEVTTSDKELAEQSTIPDATQAVTDTSTATEVTNPSFDCQKASNAVEVMICQSNELSHIDLEFATLYKAKSVLVDKNLLRTEQIAWIKNRNSCLEIDCIKNAYQVRTVELESVIE